MRKFQGQKSSTIGCVLGKKELAIRALNSMNHGAALIWKNILFIRNSPWQKLKYNVLFLKFVDINPIDIHHLITSRQRSCWKVMFPVVSVIRSVHRGTPNMTASCDAIGQSQIRSDGTFLDMFKLVHLVPLLSPAPDLFNLVHYVAQHLSTSGWLAFD